MKKWIDILGIALPALIILLGIIRVFVKNTRGINGTTFFLAVILLIAGLIRYHVFGNSSSSGNNDPKPLPLLVSKHSDTFNHSFQRVLNEYYVLVNSFIKADTAGIKRAAAGLSSSLDSFKADELKIDTLIYQTALQPLSNAKTITGSVLTATEIPAQRKLLNALSAELFSLLSIVRYDQAKIYWLECDKAFGEDAPGNWFNTDENAANPYGQAECTERRTTLNFIIDTTKKQ